MSKPEVNIINHFLCWRGGLICKFNRITTTATATKNTRSKSDMSNICLYAPSKHKKGKSCQILWLLFFWGELFVPYVGGYVGNLCPFWYVCKALSLYTCNVLSSVLLVFTALWFCTLWSFLPYLDSGLLATTTDNNKHIHIVVVCLFLSSA